MKQLKHIQDYLNGKSKKEVEDAVVFGKITFDENKYRLIKSDKKISTYAADFTEDYKAEMQSILGNKVVSPNVYIKLDDILSDGYKFSETEEKQLYVDSEDIFFGKGKSDVEIYRFEKDGAIRELLIADKNLVKGSLAMAERTSDFLEGKYEDILSKQEYVADLFGVDNRLASYVTTVLRNFDDDNFDNAIETLFLFSEQIMNGLSVRDFSKPDFKVSIMGNNPTVIRNTLFHFAGSNEEIAKILRIFIGRSTNLTVKSTRDLILAAIRKNINEIILDEDIDAYREYISKIGRYPDGYTTDISAIIDLVDIQKEMLRFILDFGDKDDFIHYMTRFTYDIRENKLQTEVENPEILDKLYAFLQSDSEINVPISFGYINSVANPIRKTNINKREKENLINKFVDTICNGKRFEFNIADIIKQIIADKNRSYNWGSKAELINGILSNTSSTEDLKEYLENNHRLMIGVENKFDDVRSKISEKKNLSMKDIRKILADSFGNCDINDGNIKVNNTIYGIECKKTNQLPEDLNIIINKKFADECFDECSVELYKDILHFGIIDEAEEGNIKAEIKKSGDTYVVEFTDGERNRSIKMDERAIEIYCDKVIMNEIAEKINQQYEKAISIKGNDGLTDEQKMSMLMELFGISSERKQSPDETLSYFISKDKKVRIASMDHSAEAEYLIMEHDYSVRVPKLVGLQRMMREVYLNLFEYEDMLANRNGLFLDKLFKPIMYSVETNSPIGFSDAICDSKGNIYIGVQKIFFSENMGSIVNRMNEDRVKSKEMLDKFLEISGDSDEVWDAKIQFVEDVISEHTICKPELFKIIHELSLGEDGIDWLRMLLSSIDVYTIAEYKDYERKFGDLCNQYMLKL